MPTALHWSVEMSEEVRKSSELSDLLGIGPEYESNWDDELNPGLEDEMKAALEMYKQARAKVQRVVRCLYEAKTRARQKEAWAMMDAHKSDSMTKFRGSGINEQCNIALSVMGAKGHEEE